MITSRVRAHLNHDQESGISIFKEDNGFSILLMIPEERDAEVLGRYCHFLSEFVTSSSFHNATEFDGVVSDAFRTANLPLSFSIACLFRQDTVVYLKTYGEGTVVLRRDVRTVPLVSHGAFASGKIEQGDEIALSIGGKDPFTNLDNCVHIEFGTEERSEERVASPEVKIMARSQVGNFSKTIKDRLSGRRPLVLLAVLVIGVLLSISIIRSYTNKTAQEDRQNLAKMSELISQKLEQAQDVFELNSGRSVALLSEAKQDLKNLESKLHSTHKNEIEVLSNKIEETEKNILQKNVKKAEEFIDLGLEEKGATGTMMWRYDDKVVIVNPKGAVYILSLEKKTLEARSSPALVGSSLAGLDDSVVYTYRKGKGVIKMDPEAAKPIVAIKLDKDWGNIADLQVFNKNIYLLDSYKGQIYKYIPTDDGFATRSSYFKSGAYAQNATSFAIDQSIFVAQTKQITKYTAGLQDGFNPTYPNDGPTIARVITGSDVDDLYIWDRSHGSVVILSKGGDYKKTIESSALTKATSVEVFNGSAYALQGSKIFKIDLK
ncbi:hypothetical protein KBC14_01210 [Candidatus Woesebacteria bacterium]|nr:hypothetical protein [Candidatus Woesebacteria bacterium]